MAYVRQRGKQLVIVHGKREPETGKVQQKILFTIYSKGEALQIVGRSDRGRADQFRYLLEYQYPDIVFNWKKITNAILSKMDVLPDLYEYKGTRLRARFREDLCAFARQLMLTDPQDFVAAGNLIQEHAVELEYLSELIQWRLKLRAQEPTQWNVDNPFYWRFTLQGPEVPPDIEEEVADLYDRGEYDRAKVLFRFLIDCFDDYAEGYNYLGLISLREENIEEAIEHFRKTIELGRKKFPRRIGRSRYWSDLSTRPYMRGLMNLTSALNRAGQYREALELCDCLEKECGDEISSAAFRAAIFLNTGRWQGAAESAMKIHKLDPAVSLGAAFAFKELGRAEDAVASFLHGALNFPRASRILAGMPTKSPRNRSEARDHNTGIDLHSDFAGYLEKSGRSARRFFKRVLRDTQVMKLIEELEDVTQRWRIKSNGDRRRALKRMNKMKTPQFARQESAKLTGILEG